MISCPDSTNVSSVVDNQVNQFTEGYTWILNEDDLQTDNREVGISSNNSKKTSKHWRLKEFIAAEVFKSTGHNNQLVICGRSDHAQQTFQCTNETSRRVAMGNRKCSFCGIWIPL